MGGSTDKIRRKVIETQKRLWDNNDLQSLVDYSLEKLKDVSSEPIGSKDEQLSEIYFWTALGVWQLTRNKDNSFSYAQRAFWFNRVNEKALWLIREITYECSEKTRIFKLLTGGPYPKSVIGVTEPVSFYTSYFVAAESVEEGLSLIKQIEQSDIGDNLAVSESEALEYAPQLPKGVYQTEGLVFYPRGQNERTT
jgi:hypothetical protein